MCIVYFILYIYKTHIKCSSTLKGLCVLFLFRPLREFHNGMEIMDRVMDFRFGTSIYVICSSDDDVCAIRAFLRCSTLANEYLGR